MGIRIHSVLGWGFRYTNGSDDPRLSDEFRELWNKDVDLLPRFKEALTVISNRQEKEDGPYDPDIFDAKLLLQRINGDQYGRKVEPFVDLYVSNFLHMGFGSECYTRYPMVFTPIEHSDWYQYDNVIDYYSCDGREDTVKPIVDEGGYPYPIYPYAIYVNRKTGQIAFRSDMYLQLRRSLHDKTIMKKKVSTLREFVGVKGEKELKVIAGIDTLIELQRDIVPQVPFSLRVFFETFHVFKNPLAMYRLKPMLYRYWS